MSKKSNMKKRIAAGAALVALSGFVPQITNNRAQAATATIKASGTFSSGIKMTTGVNLQFGIFVATGTAGKATIKTGGGTAASKGFFNGGTQKAGTIKFLAGALKKVTMTVTGMKNTLALGTFGGTKTGTVNLPTINIGGPFLAAQVFKIATTSAAVTLTSTTADLNIGGVVTWGAIQPVGTFSQNVKVIVHF